MTPSCLPFVFTTTRPKPAGIATLCTTAFSVSKGVKSGIGLDHLLKDGPDHYLGNLVFTSKTETYRLILYVDLVTNSETNHIRILTVA